MILAFILLFSAYFFCMLAIYYGFKKMPFFTSEEIIPFTGFTIVIPFRNEAENLPTMLKSIELLTYPPELFEVIFVNDASEDISEAIVSKTMKESKISIKLIQNKRTSSSPKKDAISEAIKNSRFEWIVTTDADCKLPKNWLKAFDAFVQEHKPFMVAAPVIYESNGSSIENFQQLDGFSLQTVTIGSFGLKNPLLSNGANLAYRKDAFWEVDGFSGNDQIAGGDDIFLMEKMKKVFPKKVLFLKSKTCIVATRPQQTWRGVINQRIRWASKTAKQKNLTSILLGSLVFLVTLSILALPFFMIFDAENLFLYVLLLYFKIIVDFMVVNQSAHFFGKKISFWKFQWQPILYAVLILIVVFGSFHGNYLWKGRRFQKQVILI